MLLTEPIDAENATSPFTEAIARLQTRKQQEALLAPKSKEAFAALTAAVDELVELSATVKFEMKENSNTLSISANDRTLTIIRVPGLALDSRMRNPRGMFCSLILFFSHHKDDQTSQLCSTLRVYSDGFCSNGDVHWLLNDGKESAVAFMAQLMAEHLINMQFYWPEDETFAAEMRALPVVQNQADAEDVMHRCVGFECGLPHPAETV